MQNNTSFDGTNSSVLATLPNLTWEAILAYNIYLAVSMAFGFLGNLLVLVVYCKNGTAHTTDWFIIFISTFDFISSFLNVPVYLTFTTGQWYRFGNDVICKIHMTFSQSTVIAPPLLIGGLALERYFKVCRTMSTGLSRDGSRNSCIIISVVSFVLSVPCVALYDDSSRKCNVVRTKTIILIVTIYYMAIVVVFIALFVIVNFCYANIALPILRSKKNLEKYAGDTTHETNADSERALAHCFHIMCCIHRGDASSVPQVNTSEMYVLPESSTINDKIHDRNKSAKLTKPNVSHDRRLKIHGRQSRINKSLRTTRITFIVCLIFLISWIPVWISFAINFFGDIESKRATPFRYYKLFANMSFLINTFTNPFIYVLMNRNFRKNIRKTFVCKN